MSTNTVSENRPFRRWHDETSPIVYIVVRLNTDGGDIRRNSLRALGAMAVAEHGSKLGSCTLTMSALDGSAGDSKTLDLFRKHPEAWRNTTTNPQRPALAMPAFASWVKNFPGQPVLVASPLSQTAVWLDYYLRRFTTHGVYHGPYKIDPLFYGPGVDLSTFVMGLTRRHYRESVEFLLPPEWRANREETLDVRQDVEMQAELLISMLKLHNVQG
ncbi:MAG: hypothetical protein ACRCWF_09900 [Beijerinckiaceae bacterium]